MKYKGEDVKRFDKLIGKLLKVPHSEIKNKLEKEKEEKKRKKPKRSSSASPASNGEN